MTTPARTGGRTSQGRGPAPTRYVESGRILGGASTDAGPVVEPATIIVEPAANGSKPAAATSSTGGPASTAKPPKILRDSPVIPIVLIGSGLYLMWFAVKYWRGVGPATWPSYPVKSVLQGRGIPPNQPAPSAEAELSVFEQQQGGGPGGNISGYANPFARVAGFSAGRIDQGVDVGGQGPVTAIGPGVVTYAATGPQTGWGSGQGGQAPGGFIRYKLTGGPAAGKEVYVAEGVTPTVTTGTKLTAGQVIGNMAGSVETGWASGQGTQPLSQTSQAGGIGGAGPFPTKVGVNFDRLLIALGVTAAPNLGQPASGDIPPGYPDTWSAGQVTTGKPQNTARLLLSQFGWGSGQFTPLDKLWTRESGWRSTARNPTSGALGIAQALGHGQADTAGSLGNEYGAEYGLTAAQARAANSGNALQQIRWGLGYIKARYGTPGRAWANEQALGYY